MNFRKYVNSFVIIILLLSLTYVLAAITDQITADGVDIVAPVNDTVVYADSYNSTSFDLNVRLFASNGTSNVTWNAMHSKNLT